MTTRRPRLRLQPAEVRVLLRVLTEAIEAVDVDLDRPDVSEPAEIAFDFTLRRIHAAMVAHFGDPDAEARQAEIERKAKERLLAAANAAASAGAPPAPTTGRRRR